MNAVYVNFVWTFFKKGRVKKLKDPTSLSNNLFETFGNVQRNLCNMKIKGVI